MKQIQIKRHKPEAWVTLGIIVLTTLRPEFQTQAAADPKPSDQPPPEERCFDSSFESFAPVVQKVAPAVARVVTTVNPDSTSEVPDAARDALQQYLSARTLQGPAQKSGLGSGVIVTEDGYILTSSHLVNRATIVRVTLQDGREFKAKVIGNDLESDLAVIKIEAHQLPTIPLADSRNVRVGDAVLAIGHPFGVGQTVTHGIVSATDRGGIGLEDYQSFIQTDAPINPGNSGGALVDVTGRLIGINTAIISNSGGNMGLGFAVPSDLARRVMADLVNYGYVVRGYLGVETQELTTELAEAFNLPAANGALVSGLAPNGPAEKAGLEVGDVITRFDGNDVHDVRQLRRWVTEAKPGKSISLESVRDGSSRQLQIILGQASDNDPVDPSSRNSCEPDPGALQGVIVGELNSELRQQLQVPRDVHGAVVFDLHAYSTAARAGLRPGDVIQSINRHDVASASDALQMTQGSSNRRALLRVWNNAGSHFILIQNPYLLR